ncbi:MAG TPA: 23S rRNA (pseudouridine(1915)-N(3))-methyltransferase RlmH [Thermoanaerobaculia bacterium]|nr:23S rRNA (pseudouridine(1915)-N(3))-methyltransferase RlmH [Thermoanaerobaculia bacterium]
MARELCIVWAGRHQRRDWEDLCGQYRDKIRRFTPLRDLPVKVREGSEEEAARKRAEGRALLGAVPEPCWRVALDRRGRQRTSEELAEWLARLREKWPHPIVFLIGSDLGLAPEVRAEVREEISFGPLTLPHELARLVLYEQIYRALCIAAGINYHRAEFSTG